MFENCLNYLAQNKLEEIAVVLAIAQVLLTAKDKVINWPIGIISCIIYTYIFYKASLFGDASLNIFFVVISFYGWYEWSYGGEEKKDLAISKAAGKTLILLLTITIPACFAFAKVESMYTTTDVPYWDGITTTLSIIGTWMAAKKLLESWLLWIFTDALYVILYLIKHLYLTSFLYFIFILLAVYGYYEWKKQLVKNSYA